MLVKGLQCKPENLHMVPQNSLFFPFKKLGVLCTLVIPVLGLHWVDPWGSLGVSSAQLSSCGSVGHPISKNRAESIVKNDRHLSLTTAPPPRMHAPLQTCTNIHQRGYKREAYFKVLISSSRDFRPQPTLPTNKAL